MTVAIMITAYILPGVSIKGIGAALITALVLGLVNTLVRPLLVILTFPLTVLTFGLFIFVLNAGMVLFTSALVSGFVVNSFWWALLFSVVFSVVSFILNRLVQS